MSALGHFGNESHFHDFVGVNCTASCLCHCERAVSDFKTNAGQQSDLNWNALLFNPASTTTNITQPMLLMHTYTPCPVDQPHMWSLYDSSETVSECDHVSKTLYAP